MFGAAGRTDSGLRKPEYKSNAHRSAEGPAPRQVVTPRRILLFAAVSSLLWIAPAWSSTLREAYLRQLIPIANHVFRSATNDVIRFYPALDTLTGDFELRCTNRKLGRRTVHTLKSGMLGLLPTLGVIALCAATPLPFSRRLYRLLFGLVLVHVFILLRLSVAAWFWMSEGGESAVLPLSDFTRGLLAGARTLLVTSPAVSFVAPLLIWLVVMIRPSEWTLTPGQADRAAPARDAHAA